MILSNRTELIALVALLVIAGFTLTAQATYYHPHPKPDPVDPCEGKDTLFWEDFEGYSYEKIYHHGYWDRDLHKWIHGYTEYVDFPDEKPNNDPVRLGVPMQGEVPLGGSDEFWYAAEVDSSSSPWQEDVGVQRIGGGDNQTHTGRVGDDTGLLFKLDTSNYMNLHLTFDWRTFSASGSDRFKVGYYAGDLESRLGEAFGADKFVDFTAALGSDANGIAFWNDEWVHLLSGKDNDWNTESYELPMVDELWVMFWMDGGDNDYGKFDNVHVCGDEKPDETPEIPAPAALPAGLALLGLALTRRNRRTA